MDNRPIGIFDSGVGGVTVLKEIKKMLPNENLIYLGDTKNFPYGSKLKKEIIAYATENVEFLIKNNVKLIVIACGTATSYALEYLRSKFDIPIIGIIEPTVLYIKTLGIDRVGVAATVGTINSGAWEKAIKKEIPEIEVVNKACPMLATVAEEGMAKSIEGRKIVKEYMEIFKANKIDNIILGCTHYPIYDPIIREELGYKVNLINTGVTVSKYLQGYLKNGMQGGNEIAYQKIFLSKASDSFSSIAKELLQEDTKILEK